MQSVFASKVKAGQFVYTAELNPPANHDLQDIFNEVGIFCPFVDAIDITDCAFAKPRLNPIALGYLIQDRFKKEVIFNLTCRDRNIIALQSDLLGALALGLNNILCLTGDHPKYGDLPDVSPVYNLDTIGLISLARKTQIPKSKEFFIAAATCVNLDKTNYQKINAKISAGTDYFITQPIYDIQDVKKAVRLHRKIKKPIILSILPFKSLQMIYRLCQVPGINIPKNLIAQAEKIDKKYFPKFSIESLISVAEAGRQWLNGLHIITVGEGWKIAEIIQNLSD